jgi:hypothetical protein
MPYPDDKDGGVQNWLIELDSRAWILQRDATKGSDAKEKVVQDRIGELSDRVARKVAELNSDQGGE